MDNNKINDCLKKAITLINDMQLSTGEISLLYGRLGYSLGASIEGYEGTGPNVKELESEYYSHPRLGLAMMLQGLLATSWYYDHVEQKQQEPLTIKKKEE